MLWSFFAGGIVSIIYEEFFEKHYRRHREKLELLPMAIFEIIGLGWMFVSTNFFGINFIYASMFGFLFFGVLIIVLRKDLLKDALMSGLLFGSLLLFFYPLFLLPLFPGIIEKWWMLKNISGALIFGAPIEEALWGFCWGFLAGPAYEFVFGLKTKK